MPTGRTFLRRRGDRALRGRGGSGTSKWDAEMGCGADALVGELLQAAARTRGKVRARVRLEDAQAVIAHMGTWGTRVSSLLWW